MKDHVYKLIELTGTSTTSIEDAVDKAIKRAHKIIKNLCWFQVIETKSRTSMPQGDKSSYTDKQKRQTEDIEAGYEKKGVSTETAEARAWATVNKLSGVSRTPTANRNEPQRTKELLC